MLKNVETIWLTELNLSQLNDVKQLLKACVKHDNGGPITYEHSLINTRLPPVNGLIYYQHKLIAFISTYFFYKTACECSLMVLPEYRKQGLAKGLLDTLIPVLKSQHVTSIYFSTSQSFPGQDHPQLSFFNCEKQLTKPLKKPFKKQPHRLFFRVADIEDIAELCNLDHACFASHDASVMAHRFEEVILSPQYLLVIGELNNKIIAKAHIQWQKKQSILSDIAVYPEFQRQGFGSEIVHACLIESQHRGFRQAMLEVEASNEGALKLYLNLGFKVKKVTNFWELKI